MSGKGDARLHARTQATDMEARWAATFGAKQEKRQVDPETCAHNHLHMDLYEYGSGTQHWACSRCGQASGWPQ